MVRYLIIFDGVERMVLVLYCYLQCSIYMILALSLDWNLYKWDGHPRYTMKHFQKALLILYFFLLVAYCRSLRNVICLVILGTPLNSHLSPSTSAGNCKRNKKNQNKGNDTFFFIFLRINKGYEFNCCLAEVSYIHLVHESGFLSTEIWIRLSACSLELLKTIF